MQKNKVAIIGLGYVGLPIAVALAKKGFNVLGVDVDVLRLQELNEGKSYIVDVKNDDLQKVIGKYLEVTSEYSQLRQCDKVLICVPTPLNDAKEPDVSYIINAMNEMIKYVEKDTLIILESTTYPGTTKELIVNRIEKERGYKVGEDFYVCYSPERVDPGNDYFDVMNIPKVIGGVTEECAQRGKELYASFLSKVVAVSSTEVAELSKLLENTFRSVNIALVNELAMMCERMKVDIWEVIEAAATKPFGYMPFYPGPGIGGHCIPLDPLYLAWEGKKQNYFNRFIELSADINNNMPHYVIRQIQDLLNKEGKSVSGRRVLLIGMSYKKDIDDLRESPALEIYKELKEKGAEVKFYDPYVDSFKMGNQVIDGQILTKELLEEADITVIITNHTIIDYEFIAAYAQLIYDTRNSMRHLKNDKIYKLGQTIYMK